MTESDAYSRLNKTDPVLFDGFETFGAWNNPITPTMYDIADVYVVDNAHEGRPDLIAYELYGNSKLDWVLIAMNQTTRNMSGSSAVDVLNWPRAGDVITVPDRRTITSELLA
jgi:hypothetical protein